MRAIDAKSIGVFVVAILVVTGLVPSASAQQPTTVNGDTFQLVATRSGPQLFLLVSDGQGRIYAGNNSNDVTGIPVQRFDPASFTGTAIPFVDFGPAVGDADGMAFTGAAVLVADQDQGIIKIPVTDPSAASLFLSGVAVGPFGSPFVYRPSDGHVFAGEGFVPSIREYDASGALVATHAVAAGVETMVLDPVSERIYYADFGSQVRLFDPATGADSLVGITSGFIDGGLFFDALTGLVFVGTANATNPGLVEVIDPTTHSTTLFASGFSGCTGILREPISGDLYFLDGGAHPSSGQSALYRLPSRFIPPARIRLTPVSATGPVNASHSLEAAVEGNRPLENVIVIFQITDGPNFGTSGKATTDAVGHATFSYTGEGGAGVDTLVAIFLSSDGRTIVSNPAQKEWTDQSDTTPPAITSLTTNAPTLWPPNHKMVQVAVAASAADDSGSVTTRIVTAASNEPDEGLGDGDTAVDIEITGPMTLNLRAERSGKGKGRIYTITVEAADASGNTATKQVQVRVPHSR